MRDHAVDLDHRVLPLVVDGRQTRLHHRHPTVVEDRADECCGARIVARESTGQSTPRRHRGLHHEFRRIERAERVIDRRRTIHVPSRHDRHAVRCEIDEIVLVDVPLEQLDGIPEGRRAAEPVEEPTEGRLLLHVVPRRAHHDEIVGEPVDGVVLPREVDEFDPRSGERSVDERAIEIIERAIHGARGHERDAHHERDPGTTKGPALGRTPRTMNRSLRIS